METRRRDVRYAIECAATLSDGRSTLKLLSEDVSYRGVFLRTNAAPALRQLVKVTMTLLDGSTFSAHGMTVHTVMPSQSKRIPGVGVQFYALDAKLRDRWDAFVREASTRCPEVREQALLTLTDSEPLQRKAEKYETILAVRVKSVTDLLELHMRDISAGGMFIETDHDLAPQDEIIVHIQHPLSSAHFELPAVVRHRQTGDIPGVGVEFADFDQTRSNAFLKFVRSVSLDEVG